MVIGMASTNLVQERPIGRTKSIRQANGRRDISGWIRKALRGLEPKYRRVKPVVHPDGSWRRRSSGGCGKIGRDRSSGHTLLADPPGWWKKRAFRGARPRCARAAGSKRPKAGGRGRRWYRWIRKWPGKLEVDWGTGPGCGAGQRRRILFVMRSRYSGKAFVRAYPWELAGDILRNWRTCGCSRTCGRLGIRAATR